MGSPATARGGVVRCRIPREKPSNPPRKNSRLRVALSLMSDDYESVGGLAYDRDDSSSQAELIASYIAHGRPSWFSQGKCRDHPEVTWFPERGESTKQAKEICASCPIRIACLNHAVRTGENHGIWGGAAPRKLAKLRQSTWFTFDEDQPHTSVYVPGRRDPQRKGSGSKSNPPFGFRNVNGKLVPDAAETAALSRMVELRKEGVPFSAVAETLTQEGHRPRRAEKWGTHTVQQMLTRLGEQTPTVSPVRKLSGSEQAILTALADFEHGATNTELMKASGLLMRTYYLARGKLEKSGRIERDREGHGARYKLTATEALASDEDADSYDEDQTESQSSSPMDAAEEAPDIVRVS